MSLSLRVRLFTVLFVVLAGAAVIIWYGIRPSYADAIIEERLNLIAEYQQQRIRESDVLLYFWLKTTNELQDDFSNDPDRIEISFQNYARLLPDLRGFKITDNVGTEIYNISSSETNLIPPFVELADQAYVLCQRQELWSGFLSDRSKLFLSNEFIHNGQNHRITVVFDARRVVDIMTQNVLREDAFTTIWMPDGNTLGRFLSPNQQPERTTRTSYARAVVQDKEYLAVSALFSSIPLMHSMYVDVSVLEQQVAQLFSQSLIMIIIAFFALGAGGNLMITRVQRSIKNFVEDVEPFSNYEFDRPFRRAVLPELSGVTEKMEQIRLRLDHYKRINVEQVIVQEERNRLLMNYTTEMVARIDERGKFVFVNELFSELLAELEMQANRSSVSDLFDHDRVIIRKDRFTEETPKDGLTVNGRVLEIEINISVEKVYHFELHLSDIYDENRKHLGGLLLLNDVTRSRELEKVRTEMINIIVHELQNPVSAGLGLTSYLIEEEVPRIEQLDILNMIQDSMHKLSGMIERFLQISRLESANIRVDMLPVDLNTILKPVVDSFKSSTSERNIQLIVNEETTPLVMGAHHLIEDMMRNLISNAIKYGNDRRSIDVALWSDSTHVFFSVTDHGFGIPEEFHEKIYNKFFRIKEYSAQKGTGLGLAYVKEIVQRHGGSIGLESNSRIGTRFVVALPVKNSRYRLEKAS